MFAGEKEERQLNLQQLLLASSERNQNALRGSGRGRGEASSTGCCVGSRAHSSPKSPIHICCMLCSHVHRCARVKMPTVMRKRQSTAHAAIPRPGLLIGPKMSSTHSQMAQHIIPSYISTSSGCKGRVQAQREAPAPSQRL